MCGIAGVMSLDGAPADSGLVKRMADALAHRGPDGEGFFDDGPVALGHRRLSILDLSPTGAQPMRDASGRYVVTYNGEIYNYVELRAELEAAGTRFRSRSDTEVLLEAYARWGAAAVERLNGMFAFAIWDREERVLFAARDRFGEKPFFYRFTPGREFRFASEIKALFLPGDPPPRPRMDVLKRYITATHTWQREETFYEGVSCLPAAHTMTLRGGRFETRRYWGLSGEPRPPEGSEVQQAERVRDLLEDSVRIRMRSDVALGSCLSGGIDSSTVVAMVARILERGGDPTSLPRRATFSACFPDAPNDETRFVDDVVKATGVETHRVNPDSARIAEDLPALMRALDEPFSGPAIYAEWKVLELAKRQGVTVILNGQGGDEVFAGYHFLFGDYWWSLLASGRLGTLRSEMREYDAVHGAGAAKAILRPAARQRLPRWLRGLRGPRATQWLTEEFARVEDVPGPPPPRDLRTALREALTLRMFPHLLRQADRISMAFSIEARLPFLDHRLVEFVDSLPDSMKLRGGATKWVLREAIRGLVPETVRTRNDKVGFAVPRATWLRGGTRQALLDTLHSRRARERGLFQESYVRFNLDRLERGDDAAAGPLWNVYLVEAWHQACIDGRGGGASASTPTAGRSAAPSSLPAGRGTGA